MMSPLAAFSIRASIGTVMVAFGLHQMMNPKAWLKYIPSVVGKALPVKQERFMQSHGVINVGLGLLFIGSSNVIFVSWATFAWWASIVPFAAKDDWRDGMRDFAITSAVLALIMALYKK